MDFPYDLLAQTCADYDVGTMTKTLAFTDFGDHLSQIFLHLTATHETRLDTQTLVNMMMLENVSNVEASIKKGCMKVTHFMGLDKEIYL